MEDDMIKHLIFHSNFDNNLSYVEKQNIVVSNLVNKYNDILQQNGDTKLYICTHLFKSTNINNKFFSAYKRKHNNIIINTEIWKNKYNIPKGREIDAIIDYLIVLDGDSFVGYVSSTYSQFIDKYYFLNNKKSLLNKFIN